MRLAERHRINDAAHAIHSFDITFLEKIQTVIDTCLACPDTCMQRPDQRLIPLCPMMVHTTCQGIRASQCHRSYSAGPERAGANQNIPAPGGKCLITHSIFIASFFHAFLLSHH
ncbi:MAG: hypothetical protein Q9M29_08695 [Mariprofundaceae bacterium]|nr:hypothetical protein [Mariprofundaceae bacterium]